MPNAQIVVSVDASGDAIKVVFGSVNKSGKVTGYEKALVSKAVNAMGTSKEVPPIGKLNVAGQGE